MKCNVGATDRTIRFILGIVLLLWAFTGLSGTAAWVAGILGVVFLVTAAIRFCPLYLIFGINTCSESEAKS